MNSIHKVGIIGGGWAGLAAGVELAEAGAQVTVFEAAKQLGGRARSVEVNGHILDNGQHLLIGAYRETLRLMRKVGAEPDRLFKRLPLELSYPANGFSLKLPRLPAPLHLAAGLFGARGCPAGEKIAAVRFMRHLQGRQFKLEADCSVTELLDRHDQQGVLRHCLWEALCLAALNTPPRDASAQIFANVLRDSLGGGRADTDLLLPAADLGQVFPQAAARFISTKGGAIRCSTRVDNLSTDLCINGENFDDVILATGPQHAAPLLAALPETTAVAEMLATYVYEPIGTVYLGYPADVTLPLPMLGLDCGSPGKLGQWVFDRGVLCDTPGIISFVLSASGAWDALSNHELAVRLHHELEQALRRTLPHPLPHPLWHQTIRERRATFACRPNLPRPTAQTPLRGLWLAGDYVCADYPATLEAAVRSGIAAAKGLLES